MRTNRRYALLLGLLLLIEGAWGFFSPVVFGLLTTNLTHACIHVALGVGGLWAAATGRAGGYATLVGIILIVVGGLWFFATPQEFLRHTLNLNQAVAVVNLVVGVTSLLVAFGSRADVVKS